MQPLDRSSRNRLERTIKDARDIAETAARAAMEQLGVCEPSPYPHLNDSDRDLRRRLRAHGRQLGDRRKPNGDQATDRLMEKIAYEHWHRMLFARFLAENDLLMYPDPEGPMAVTLAECEDLAADEGAANGWELAARFAARMLPQIFRLDSPVFELPLPPEHQQNLERLLADLPSEVFVASDSLGWVYQFWQAKKKDEVNASEVKIGARELPTVTQLFTEPYMVSFLLDNSLGAWWAARRLSESDLKNASTEEELRQKASIPGVPLEYLRFVQQEDGAWTPAAGTFDGWPAQLADLKTLDPCCGSGHFLVAAFLMLVPMRMERDDLLAQEAVDAVLRENIHGLELDQRCVELAAFALALIAWKYPEAGGYHMLPELNVACSGLSISASKEDWLALAKDNSNLQLVLEEFYVQFRDAPILGSLLSPETVIGEGPLFKIGREEIEPLLTKALAGEKDDTRGEIGVAARGIYHAATILAETYSLVLTNVPYRSSNDLAPEITTFFSSAYADASTAIETVFLLRCLQFCHLGASTCLVLPQDWLFKTSYKPMSKRLLTENSWNFIAVLGPKAFQTPMWDLNVQLLFITKGDEKIYSHGEIRGLDVSRHRSTDEKSERIKKSDIQKVKQLDQLSNPDARIVLHTISKGVRLDKHAKSVQGIKTGDDGRVRRNFWEIVNFGSEWEYYQSTFSSTCFFGGLEHVIYWGDEGCGLARRQGNRAWSTMGLAVSQMAALPAAIYLGEKFDSNMTSIVPLHEEHLYALLAYGLSGELATEVRKIDSSLKPTNGSFEKIPFELERWIKAAREHFPRGIPNPFTDNPTQWIFHGHPCGSVIWDDSKKSTTFGPLRRDGTVLQIAVIRLLGYHWPAESDTDIELAEEQRKWVERCKTLASYADDDGIACIPPVRGEASASDRLLSLLAKAYGDAWSTHTLTALLKSADHGGKTLETWLREKFFTQHCKLFKHRPFIWHIWDGLRDGFAVLVNYHKLDAKLLETLIYTYLGDWISRQKQDIAANVDGAQERLVAAENLKRNLELILEGEAPYHTFVRWKPIEEQSIGWNPDLNDGVRLNIRPFLTVPDVGKKGAGILRDKPNIHWNKDRGKDLESAPWHHLFQGDRINDYPLTLAEKRAARETAK